MLLLSGLTHSPICMGAAQNNASTHKAGVQAFAQHSWLSQGWEKKVTEAY
jgi:hypothetical protein